MTRPWLALAAAGACLGAAAAAAQTADLDGPRGAWRYRRPVLLPPAPTEGFVALALPPELAAQGQGDLRDLRLLGPDGREVPYVLDRAVQRLAVQDAPGRLVDTRQEPLGTAAGGRGRSTWVVDLGEARRFDAVALQIPSHGFAKRMRLEASDDARSWRVLREAAAVFEAPWSQPARVSHTTIGVEPAQSARYLRLVTEDDRRSPPVVVTGVAVRETRRAEREEGRRALELQPAGSNRYRLGWRGRFPFEEISIETDEPVFARRVRLIELTDAGGERTLADGLLYRLRLRDAALAGEGLSLALTDAPAGGPLLLEVQDGDSPPLRRLRASASGAAVRLLFAGTGGPLTLYYGNEVTRPPLYDLAPLRERLALSGELLAAGLGPEAENPRYQRAAPLPFTAARGAPVEAGRWRAQRRIDVEASEDLWALTLDAEDLAAARPDLGDLRIVDAADRQVPYILETAVAERRVPLAIEKGAPPGRGPAAARSRHRLRLREGGQAKPLALPLSAVELEAQEAFFDRPFRLWAEPGAGERQARTLAAGRLSRKEDPRPIRIALGEPRLGELLLEIDEGDNAPLVLTEAQAVVRVPRVTFKAAPGAYRLLLGNREAEAPRYDLAALRGEVLSYSAFEVPAAAREPNPAFRRFAGDALTDAPPTLLLWGTLLAAVAALLFLTARVLRQPPAPAPEE